MNFTDLFSHLDVPEVAPKTEGDSESVQAPTFSDNGGETESTTATSPS